MRLDVEVVVAPAAVVLAVMMGNSVGFTGSNERDGISAIEVCPDDAAVVVGSTGCCCAAVLLAVLVLFLRPVFLRVMVEAEVAVVIGKSVGSAGSKVRVGSAAVEVGNTAVPEGPVGAVWAMHVVSASCVSAAVDVVPATAVVGVMIGNSVGFTGSKLLLGISAVDVCPTVLVASANCVQEVLAPAAAVLSSTQAKLIAFVNPGAFVYDQHSFVPMGTILLVT